MDVYLTISFVSMNHKGSSLYKIFLDKSTYDIPSLPLRESIRGTQIDICRKYFDVDPSWLLEGISLVDVTKEEKLIIKYSCLVPEIESKNGIFVPITNMSNLTKVISALRMN